MADLVVKYEVLKAQNLLEEKARAEWFYKWGFYLDFDQMLIEEASKRGISKAEYQRRTTLRKPKGSMEPDIWQIKPSNYVPKTTAGAVGWRAHEEHNLEKFGPLYVSPKSSLPYEPPSNYIFLG